MKTIFFNTILFVSVLYIGYDMIRMPDMITVVAISDDDIGELQKELDTLLSGYTIKYLPADAYQPSADHMIYSYNSQQYITQKELSNYIEYISIESLVQGLPPKPKKNMVIIHDLDNDDAMPGSNDVEKDPISDEELYDEALATFEHFVELQNLIANESSREVIEELIEQSISLFISDQSTIQIQNLSSTAIIELPIHRYLQRLNRLSRYDRVDIDWAQELTILKPWQEINTKSKTTLASNVQSFSGYNKEMLLYSDRIKKSIVLRAERISQINPQGVISSSWKIKIGDIKVASLPSPQPTTIT